MREIKQGRCVAMCLGFRRAHLKYLSRDLGVQRTDFSSLVQWASRTTFSLNTHHVQLELLQGFVPLPPGDLSVGSLLIAPPDLLSALLHPGVCLSPLEPPAGSQ